MPTPLPLLVVDDEPLVRRVLRRSLEAAGYAVLEAGNGLEALDRVLLLQGRVGAVVTDLEMPEMNGTELGARLTNLYRDLPVIFLSGYDSDALAERGMIGDDSLFLRKPVVPEKLVTLVDMAIAVTEPRRGESARVLPWRARDRRSPRAL